MAKALGMVTGWGWDEGRAPGKELYQSVERRPCRQHRDRRRRLAAVLPRFPALAGRFTTLHSFTVNSRGKLCDRVRALPEGLVAAGPPSPDRCCQRCHPRGSRIAKVHSPCVGAQAWLLQDDVQVTAAQQQGQTSPAGCFELVVRATLLTNAWTSNVLHSQPDVPVRSPCRPRQPGLAQWRPGLARRKVMEYLRKP